MSKDDLENVRTLKDTLGIDIDLHVEQNGTLSTLREHSGMGSRSDKIDLIPLSIINKMHGGIRSISGKRFMHRSNHKTKTPIFGYKKYSFLVMISNVSPLGSQKVCFAK